MDKLNNINEENKNMILEQYKLYVEMADKISQQRSLTNSFYITINTTLLACIGLKVEKFDNFIIVLAILGVILSIIWWFNIHSYSRLNSGKFKIIHQMENYLPFKAYTSEWNVLKNRDKRGVYIQISSIEKYIPLLFLLLYIAIVIFKNLK